MGEGRPEERGEGELIVAVVDVLRGLRLGLGIARRSA